MARAHLPNVSWLRRLRPESAGNQGCGSGERLLKSLVPRAWKSRNRRHPSTHLNDFAMIVKRREEWFG
jgi:hypothetical protein